MREKHHNLTASAATQNTTRQAEHVSVRASWSVSEPVIESGPSYGLLVPVAPRRVCICQGPVLQQWALLSLLVLAVVMRLVSGGIN